MQNPHKRFFRQAPLSRSALTTMEALRAAVIADDRDVQRVAATLRFRVQHMVEASFQNLIGEAIDIAAMSTNTGRGGSIATLEPAEVVEAMNVLMARVEAELRLAKEEALIHQRARRALYGVLQPLRAEVSARLDSAVTERDTLHERVRSLESTAGSAGVRRYEALKAQGLSDTQIAALDTTGLEMDRQHTVNASRERVVALNAEIAKLKDFCDDPYHDPARLDGLDGFAGLLAAQEAALTQGAAA
jgi:hypothetical protein